MPRNKIQERFIVPRKQRAQILASCGNRCAHCGKKLTWDATIEHVIPLSKGGTYDPENLVALCKKCNKSKSNDIVQPKEFYTALSPERRKKLQHMVDKYCKNTDWLDKTNLFPLDQFETKIQILQSYHASIRVEKLRRHEILTFMTEYQSKLGPVEMAPVIETEIKHGFYRVIFQEKAVMVVSPYIIETDGKLNIDPVFEAILSDDITGYMTVLDVFVNPDVKDNGKLTTKLLANICAKITDEITKTMRRKGAGLVMQMLIAADKKDLLAERMLREMNRRITLNTGMTWHLKDADRNGIQANRNASQYNLLSKLTGDINAWNAFEQGFEKLLETPHQKRTKDELLQEVNQIYRDFWKRVETRITEGRTEE